MARPHYRLHTDAVKAALMAATTPPRPVGVAEAPAGASPETGYYVVYPLTGGSAGGTLADPQGDAELLYQVTCVGSSGEQAQWLADMATDAILTGVTPPTGRKLPRIALEALPGVGRDDQQETSIFWSAPQFRIFTTPA